MYVANRQQKEGGSALIISSTGIADDGGGGADVDVESALHMRPGISSHRARVLQQCLVWPCCSDHLCLPCLCLLVSQSVSLSVCLSPERETPTRNRRRDHPCHTKHADTHTHVPLPPPTVLSKPLSASCPAPLSPSLSRNSAMHGPLTLTAHGVDGDE